MQERETSEAGRVDRVEGVKDRQAGVPRGREGTGPGDHGPGCLHPAFPAPEHVPGWCTLGRHVLAQAQDHGELRGLHTAGRA